jgi:uracil-DNA glycosylase
MTKIMLVGEAWGQQEAEARMPFVGKSGWLIKQLLSQVGLAFEECFVTNVLNLQPPGNDVKNLCGTKAEGIPGFPALVKGKFLRKEYTNELARLYSEIERENPNIIIALGATAAWALLGTSGIKSIRGAPSGTNNVGRSATGVSLSRTYKVLPTYHPAAVLRDWSLRPIVLSDLDKAKRYSTTELLSRPERFIWVEPSIEDLLEFEQRFINEASYLSIDIETKLDQITCIGFAPSPDVGLVVPFWSKAKSNGNYWPSLEEELKAWDYVRKWCMKPGVFQNGMYDVHRLWRTYGIPTNPVEDTMLMHHTLQPEMEKGLAFLGTIYTDEASWKFMSRADTLKKED